jgi:hypothetical protein
MEKFAKQMTEKFIDTIQDEENRSKIENNVLNPIVKYIAKRLWPYIVTLSISLVFLLFILGYLIYITFHLQKDIRLRDLKQ